MKYDRRNFVGRVQVPNVTNRPIETAIQIVDDDHTYIAVDPQPSRPKISWRPSRGFGNVEVSSVELVTASGTAHIREIRAARNSRLNGKPSGD